MNGAAPAGRFAPSPTGPLHIGSLYSALASFLDARTLGLEWRLRFDDLDQQRNAPHATRHILNTLEAHGLHWDGPVQHQSDHLERYQQAVARLRQREAIFFCTCSRQDLATSRVYPGHCRERTNPIADASLRVRVEGATVAFTDLVQGRQRCNLERTTGDFIVKRRDGPFSYHLATAVDDGDSNIVRVLRGRDLLANTPAQLHLMQLLHLQAPTYAHIPVLLNPAGQKWSKQTQAAPVNDDTPAANIRACLALLLGLQAPALSLEALMHWALEHWEIRRLKQRNQVFDPAAPPGRSRQ